MKTSPTFAPNIFHSTEMVRKELCGCKRDIYEFLNSRVN